MWATARAGFPCHRCRAGGRASCLAESVSRSSHPERNGVVRPGSRWPWKAKVEINPLHGLRKRRRLCERKVVVTRSIDVVLEFLPAYGYERRLVPRRYDAAGSASVTECQRASASVQGVVATPLK